MTYHPFISILNRDMEWIAPLVHQAMYYADTADIPEGYKWLVAHEIEGPAMKIWTFADGSVLGYHKTVLTNRWVWKKVSHNSQRWETF